ncbi:hypothetical protein T265_03721 [Opisthorchis viverrini]|uniref:Uncharacterized protein n=1 Tax=Opisthorchis viverrini TaxID=6198 RepID=A0A075AHD7_OPIVI|nr:hypothetical protein T265_03721 [Opisthorchis viverrini]KER29704.1 hypothetical protein T265_03721 [Opisthorchis viverrini]
MPTDRLQTIEYGSKTLICILVPKSGRGSFPERVFLEIRCLHTFVGQIQANVPQWSHEFTDRIPFFNRPNVKFYERHILLACLPMSDRKSRKHSVRSMRITLLNMITPFTLLAEGSVLKFEEVGHVDCSPCEFLDIQGTNLNKICQSHKSLQFIQHASGKKAEDKSTKW